MRDFNRDSGFLFEINFWKSSGFNYLSNFSLDATPQPCDYC